METLKLHFSMTLNNSVYNLAKILSLKMFLFGTFEI